ncbi:MAG: B12-binding domain-containing radical SAM protein [Candidatus Aminicenantes bacterium]|nr:B12-binding domain-containing radical SAM protein [Candidatus Aminicenantes bacterium]
MFQVLLINPPFEFEAEATGVDHKFKNVINIVAPLGIAYVAATLEKMQISVKIIDCATGVSYQELYRRIHQMAPDVIGITSTTPSFSNATKVARYIKDNLPKCKILLGGAHVTAVPKLAMDLKLFDIGVIGEAELIIENLFNNFRDGQFENLENIKGIIYLKGDEIIQNEREDFIKDLDTIAFPSRHLLPDLIKYLPTPASARRVPYATVMTSRGCPTRCTFCDRAIFGEKIRLRSVENIMTEIDHLVEHHGVREIRFFDDTFTINKKRTMALCEELMSRDYKLLWTCLTKVNCVDEELLKKMKEAGCWQILYGFESGDDRMLKILGKHTSVEKNQRAIKMTKKAGIEVRGDFILGTPGETWESLKHTLDFTLNNNLGYAHYNKFTPFPGTQLTKELEIQGYTFDLTHSSIIEHEKLHYVNPGMDPNEFLKFLDLAHRKFYLRPIYILKRLFKIRSLFQLKGQIRGFFALIRF